MPVAKVTSKGQVTIPVGVRRSLGVKEGDLLAFEVQADYVVVRRQRSLREASDAARALTAGRVARCASDDEAVQSAFDHAKAENLGEEIAVIEIRPEDLR